MLMVSERSGLFQNFSLANFSVVTVKLPKVVVFFDVDAWGEQK
jgi:hypothetical protein